MQIICAWCNKPIANSADFACPGHSVEISHGICPTCSDSILHEATQQLIHRLMQLEEPLLLLDSDGKVQLANSRALCLLGMTESRVIGQPLAAVLGCVDCHSNPAKATGLSTPETCMLDAQIRRTITERRTLKGQFLCEAPVSADTPSTPLILKTRFLCERVLLSLQPGTDNTTRQSFSMDPPS